MCSSDLNAITPAEAITDADGRVAVSVASDAGDDTITLSALEGTVSASHALDVVMEGEPGQTDLTLDVRVQSAPRLITTGEGAEASITAASAGALSPGTASGATLVAAASSVTVGGDGGAPSLPATVPVDAVPPAAAALAPSEADVAFARRALSVPEEEAVPFAPSPRCATAASDAAPSPLVRPSLAPAARAAASPPRSVPPLPFSPSAPAPPRKPRSSVANAAGSEERRVGKECRSRWSPDH